MAWTLIGHSTGNSSISGGTATTTNFDTTGANLILLATSNYSTDGSSPPVDSKGNTYTLIGSVLWSTNFVLVRLWVCIAPTVGSGHTFSQSASYNVIQAQAWNTGLTGATLDRVTTAVGPTAATLIPRQNNELLVTAYGNADSTFGLTCSGGFTVTDSRESVGGDGQSFAYLLQTTSAASTPTWSGSGQGSTIQASYAASNNTDPTLTLDGPPTNSVLPKPVVPVLQTSTSITKGLLGAWTLHDGSGLLATDLGPLRNNGILSYSPVWSGSLYGSCLSFSGAVGWVDLGNKLAFDLSGKVFSIAALIYPTGRGSNSTQIIANDNSSGNRQFFFDIGALTGKLDFCVFNTNSNYTLLTGNSIIPLNRTSFVAAVYSGSTSSVYVNGVLDGSMAAVSSVQGATANSLWIGARMYASFNDYFIGKIISVFLWTRVLSQAEISQLSYDPFAMFRKPSRLYEAAASMPAFVPPSAAQSAVTVNVA